MAELAAIKDKATLERFVRRIRRALWLGIIFDQFGLGLRAGAGFVVICGFLHVFVHALSISVGIVSAVAPIGCALLLAAGKQPGIVEAACYADQRFNGKSLLTTAVDVLHGVNRRNSDFSPLIVRQAAQSVTTWQQQLERLPLRSTQSFPVWILAVAMLGGFMLLQPGKTDNPLFNDTEKNTRATQLSKPETASANRLLETIKKQESLAETTDEAHAENFNSESEHASQSDNNLQPLAKEAKSLDTGSDQASSAIDTNNQSQHAKGKQGIGDEADLNPTATRYSEHKDMELKLIETTLGSGDLVSNAKTGTALANGNAPLQRKSPQKRIAAASAGATSAYVANLSFSQQYYVAAYFQLSHSQQ